jgi:hypothetical protein
VPLEAWIFQPGIPDTAPQPAADAFAKVQRQAQDWLLAGVPASSLETAGWTTHEWLHFLKSLPDDLRPDQMTALDRAFRLSDAGNAEVAHQWLLMAIRNAYEPAYPRLEAYLVSIGRRKLIRPLYEALMKTPDGSMRGRAIYAKARPGYHPIAVDTLDPIVGRN